MFITLTILFFLHNLVLIVQRYCFFCTFQKKTGRIFIPPADFRFFKYWDDYSKENGNYILPFGNLFVPLHKLSFGTKHLYNMVKHIILWTLNPELTEEEKQTVKAGIKAGLEGLVGKVPGLIDVKVNIDGRLSSSNADVMLDSTLESEEALRGYAQHPEHVAVANTKVRPYTVQRSCLDFEI